MNTEIINGLYNLVYELSSRFRDCCTWKVLKTASAISSFSKSENWNQQSIPYLIKCHAFSKKINRIWNNVTWLYPCYFNILQPKIMLLTHNQESMIYFDFYKMVGRSCVFKSMNQYCFRGFIFHLFAFFLKPD